MRAPERDMTWCVHSCPIVSSAVDLTFPSHEWMLSLPVPEAIDCNPPVSHRLGIRFEALVQTWIEETPHLQLLAANLPVRDDTRTIGEFDLIVDNDGAIEHWELAVKFYLAVGDATDASQFYGPNPVDTLATKIDRLRSHQLQLSHHPAAQQLLKENGWQVEHVRCFLKGRLFYPLEDWRSGNMTSPAIVHPDHETGWWCDQQTFNRAFRDLKIFVLEKSHWLAPVTPEDVLSNFTGEFRGGTQHVVHCDDAGNELSRGFVVSDAWLRDVKQDRS